MQIYLDKIAELFNEPRTLDNRDLESFMLNVRLVIEHEKLKDQYSILNLYCNWCMHTKIKDSIVAYRILEHITKAIVKCNKDPKTSIWYSDAVIEGIKLHDLQYEIEDFIFRFNLKIGLFRDRMFWNGFGRILIHNLIGRPLELNLTSKSSKLQRLIQSIKSIADESKQPQFTVCSLEFIYVNNKQSFRVVCGQGANQITMLGEMVIISFDEYLAKKRTDKANNIC